MSISFSEDLIVNIRSIFIAERDNKEGAIIKGQFLSLKLFLGDLKLLIYSVRVVGGGGNSCFFAGPHFLFPLHPCLCFIVNTSIWSSQQTNTPLSEICVDRSGC